VWLATADRSLQLGGAEALFRASTLIDVCNEIKGIGDYVDITIANHQVAFDVASDMFRARVCITPEQVGTQQQIARCLSCNSMAYHLLSL
jgi:hypothetical protein